MRCSSWCVLSLPPYPGALLGWLVLNQSSNTIIYGVSLTMAAGMMVYLSLKELLPVANKLDSTNGLLTSAFLFGGMAAVTALLVLVEYTA